MEYNGWTNWETWNFKLWIDNDEEIRKLVEYLMQDWDDEPDQPDPDEGETGDCCNECEYWESQVDVMIDNQIKESKMEKFDPYEDITEEDKELYNNAPPATGMVRR